MFITEEDTTDHVGFPIRVQLVDSKVKGLADKWRVRDDADQMDEIIKIMMAISMTNFSSTFRKFLTDRQIEHWVDPENPSFVYFRNMNEFIVARLAYGG